MAKVLDACVRGSARLGALESRFTSTLVAVRVNEAGGSACGNGICDSTENALTCPNDCPDLCGDGLCTGVENATNCSLDCAPVCGDGVVEGDEECEGGVPLADTCQSLGFDKGTLSCNGSTCAYDTSDCAHDQCLPRWAQCSDDSECCSGSCRGWRSRRCR